MSNQNPFKIIYILFVCMKKEEGKIIIIGAGPAGFTTAFILRKLNKKAEILVIDKAKKGYSPCCLPYVVSGEIKEKDIFVVKKGDYEKNNIKRIFKTVKKIDRKNKEIILDSRERLSYNNLVLATGSKPFIPKIKGLDKTNFFSLKTLENEQKIFKNIKKAKKAVIIGGGWLGIEIAESLAAKGMKVIILEAKERILSALVDKEIADKIKEILTEKNIKVFENVSVKEVKNKKILLNKKEINFDILLVITGMKPNIKLASESRIKTDRGIIVNKFLQTSDKNIYACGDCIELIDKITKKKNLSLLGSTAIRAAKAVAKNILGFSEEFPQVFNAAVAKIGKSFLGRIGITEEKAKQNNMKCVAALFKSETKDKFCPDKKEILIKMISDVNGKILGVQLVGKEEIAPRINLISAAMQKNMTVFDIAKTETCFNPMSSPMLEPLSAAAEACIQKIKS